MVEQTLAYAATADIAQLADGPTGAALGRQLIDRFRLEVICVTGRPEGVGAGLDGASEVVMKPFSEEQVAAASHVRPSGMLPAMIGFDSRILFLENDGHCEFKQAHVRIVRALLQVVKGMTARAINMHPLLVTQTLDQRRHSTDPWHGFDLVDVHQSPVLSLGSAICVPCIVFKPASIAYHNQSAL